MSKDGPTPTAGPCLLFCSVGIEKKEKKITQLISLLIWQQNMTCIDCSFEMGAPKDFLLLA